LACAVLLCVKVVLARFTRNNLAVAGNFEAFCK